MVGGAPHNSARGVNSGTPPSPARHGDPAKRRGPVLGEEGVGGWGLTGNDSRRWPAFGILIQRSQQEVGVCVGWSRGSASWSLSPSA